MRSARSEKKQKPRKTAIITGLLIPYVEVGKSEVTSDEPAIIEYMPADERAFDGCRREG